MFKFEIYKINHVLLYFQDSYCIKRKYCQERLFPTIKTLDAVT